MNTGAIIKKRRIELGLTLLDIAEACGVSDATVSRWESGNIGNMKTSRIADLAEILKLSPLVLLGMEKNTYQTETDQIEAIEIPLFNRKLAVDGKLTEDTLIDRFILPSSIIASGRKYFAIYAHYDRMDGDGIFDTDILVFESKSKIDTGRIGCFYDINHGIVVRKFFLRPGTKEVVLQPSKPGHLPLFLEFGKNNFKVLGELALTINNRQVDLTSDQIHFLWDREEAEEQRLYEEEYPDGIHKRSDTPKD
ncbi:MAG: helix-turn-helix domain-containing protein [Paludibacter sp.]|nr:helix-turn-helix domain-containing protein [Paludibacter sp.]